VVGLDFLFGLFEGERGWAVCGMRKGKYYERILLYQIVYHLNPFVTRNMTDSSGVSKHLKTAILKTTLMTAFSPMMWRQTRRFRSIL
jgi:hypothetical protein